MVGLMYEMVGGRMIQQKIYYGRNYFIRLSDYSLLFRMANRIFAYGYNKYRSMILETEIDGLLYSLDSDEQEAMVKECIDKKREGEVVIPDSFFHQGIVYRVTGIGARAFWNCRSLTSITIPKGVTSIGNSAFGSCTNLTAIVVTEGNKVYDSRGGCNAIIETVSNTLIAGCSTTIIPESVKSIGEDAFFGCTSLATITIPEGVTSIENWAFHACNSLTAIVVAEGNKVYDSRGGCNAIIETVSNTLIAGCSTTIIPESVKSIGECAFSGCTSLAAITIPEGVTSIGSRAFSFCRSLISISIPEGVTSIGDWTFFRCSDITTITLPEGVTSIGNHAFSCCTSLTAITIPESVKSIGEGAFSGCRSLVAITIPEGVTSIENDAFEGCRCLTTITLPEGVTSIGNDAFSCCTSLTTITIPEGVTSIENDAFSFCRLERITINCTNVGSWFRSFSSIKEIVLGEGVTRIGAQAFYNCRSLTAITIPENSQLTSIGEHAFEHCSSLTSILIPESVTSIRWRAFLGCTCLTTINIPKSMTSIGWRTFWDCRNLTSILIPTSVTSIGEWALRDTGITYLTILGKPRIDKDAFAGCEKLTDVYCYSEEVPPGENAFGSLDLSRITLHVPESALEAYKNTEPWSRFGTIVAIK